MTIKPCEPYNNISDMLSLIPKNIIPNFSRYLIEKANRPLYILILLFMLVINDPKMIAIIIGDIGLLSRFNIFKPIKFDIFTDRRAVIMQIHTPIIVFLFIYLAYYT